MSFQAKSDAKASAQEDAASANGVTDGEACARLDWFAQSAPDGDETGGHAQQAEGGEHLRIHLQGAWTTLGLADAERRLRNLSYTRWQTATIDISETRDFDTAGAWALVRLRRALEAEGAAVTVIGSDAAKDSLIQLVEGVEPTTGGKKRLPPPLNLLALIGENAVANVKITRDLLGFLGLSVVSLLLGVIRPSRLRWTAIVNQMEKVGMNAIPIVGLLAFLIGVVLAYQGAEQLAFFGAEIFVVNLLGVSILREMGVLITSIVVAGRSGSAFAAQIGTMKVNQEVDAMRTIGLDPMQELVLPRIVAMGLMLPLLTFFANVMGLLGGAIMCMIILDIQLVQFARQLNDAIDVQTFMVGMIKAPVFAFVIGVVGCFEGMKVGSNAESVGVHTTRAVVEAIFLVIMLDALFSILFSVLGV